MTGSLDEYGFFAPDRDQVALNHLLAATQLESWEAFHRAMNPKDNTFELSNPSKEMAELLGMRRKVIPGLSVMHESTYDAICALSQIDEDPVEAAAARAAIIVMDASERFEADKDIMFMRLAQLGKPYDRTYETKSGRQIEAPQVGGVLSKTAPWDICVYAKDAIERVHRKSHETDGSALRGT